MAKTVLGIIGGSGFYQMSGLERVEEIALETPFGPPSDAYYCGQIDDVEIVFLSRHGRGHRILPSELNYRANLWGMKKLGVERLISVSSAGSMKEEIAPGDLLVANQFVDHTYFRKPTFFGDGIVAHVSLADPVCADLSRELVAAGRAAGAKIHDGGTYFCIEGPQFSTRAESKLYRSWGVDVISMTAMQEARLAREAELCYAVLVLVTDYDCWHASVAAVDIGEILRVMRLNVDLAQQSVMNLSRTIGSRPRNCACGSSLKDAIITDRAAIPAETIAKLEPIIGKYIKSE
ncbi:MAG TPA: S-methyl-5'-thioadenosine phosphorylase [Candidatus Binataceae bacterium]|jgi:5'-methylthioadenosine phosphorylase|nr:S-methyl-5'-thioadenosine phosphorylase [Candidatus Binataceae bacterium]